MNGVNITIIIYNDHINKKELFKSLYYEGSKIYLSKKLMHNKFCIIDHNIIINGSYNWTLNANSNRENIQMTRGNRDLIFEFEKEFKSIKKECKAIDDYFEYSLANIDEMDKSFNYFQLEWKKLNSIKNYPYFIDFTSLKISEVNKNQNKIKLKYYLILDEQTEQEMLWIYFILQSNICLSKILQLKKKAISLPLRLEYIFSNHKSPNAIHFTTNDLTVLEYKWNFNYYKKYIYRINQKGEPISEKIFFSEKLDDETFIKIGKNAFLINHKMNITPLKLEIEKVIDRKHLVFKKNYMFGVCDLQEKTIISPIYSSFQFWNNILFLRELPLIVGNKNNNTFTYKPNISGYGFPSIPSLDIYEHEFMCQNNTLTRKSRKLIKGSSTQENQVFLFNSDENYKFYQVYILIKNLFDRMKIEWKKDDNSYSEMYLYGMSFEDFLFIRDNYDNKYLINEKVAMYRNKAMSEKRKSLFEEHQKTKQKKEGCYIATMVYGDYHHTEVLFLRDFRDTVLAQSDYGQKFIKWYYKNSPQFVNYVKDKPVLYSLTSGIIYTLVFLLKKIFKRNKK